MGRARRLFRGRSPRSLTCPFAPALRATKPCHGPFKLLVENRVLVMVSQSASPPPMVQLLMYNGSRHLGAGLERRKRAGADLGSLASLRHAHGREEGTVLWRMSQPNIC